MIRVFYQYVSPKGILLVSLEGILMALSLLGGVKLYSWAEPGSFHSNATLPVLAGRALLIVAVFQFCFYYNHLYDANRSKPRRKQWIRLGESLAAGAVVLGLLQFASPVILISPIVVVLTVTLVAASVLAGRFAIETAWEVAAPVQNILILGTGGLALNVARELACRDDLNIKLIGFITNEPGQVDGNGTWLGTRRLVAADRLESVVVENQVSRIIVAMEDRRAALPVDDLMKLRLQGCRIEDAHSTLAGLTGRVWLDTLRPSWFVFSEGFRRSRSIAALKRAIDVVFGLAGLVVSAPLMALVALAIRLDSRGPILYRQVRVGLRGRPFHVLKFRSMDVYAEANGEAQWAREHDPRVTRVGRFLRKFRLDELPQFLNVVRGEMSFVGPRPERPVFVERLRRHIFYYDARHSARPGITGWAQVQYPYGASVEDAARKLEYDLFYLKNMSLLFDLAILLKTVRIVLLGRGGR